MSDTANNIVYATFETGSHFTRTRRITQYDYGMVLAFSGIELPVSFEAHFSNTDETGETITQIGNDQTVAIPDELLLTGLPVYCWVYLHTGETDGKTVYKVTIPVKKRAQPSDLEPTPVQQDAITQAIAALNSAVTQTGQDVESAAASASDASDSAEAAKASMEAARTAEDGAQRAEANAQGYAEDAEGYADAANRDASVASQAAQGALASAQAALQSASNASDARQGAEAAQSNAQAAQGLAEAARSGAENAQAAAEQAARDASSAKTDAVNAKTAAENAQGLAETAKADAITAKNGAISAKTDAVAAKGDAEQAASDAANSAQSAQDAAEECEILTDAVAKEVTAQSILTEAQEISAALEGMNVIKFYPELPETGTNGFVYITPDGIYYYDGTTDEFISCAGSGGSLNGFSFALDSDRRISVTYVNPEDETDTDSATIPSADTTAAMVVELQGINAALSKIAEGGE